MTGGTPLIVNTDIGSFHEYVTSLSRSARKDWAYVSKHNHDLVYEEAQYDEAEMQRFMEIWSRQLIHGNETVAWAFGVGHVTDLHRQGVLMVFRAKRGDEVIAMHFIEKHGDYLECHPPMYDKKYAKRYLAKFMWFHLIEWAIGNDTKFLDLGSGDRGTWRDLVTNRKQYPRIAYKWMYIADAVKKHPESEKPYLVYERNGHKWISETNPDAT